MKKIFGFLMLVMALQFYTGSRNKVETSFAESTWMMMNTYEGLNPEVQEEPCRVTRDEKSCNV